MNVVSQIASVATGVVLIAVFVLEGFVLRRLERHPVFLMDPGESPGRRPWAADQSVYTLGFGIAAIGGVAVVRLGHEAVGQTLVVLTAVGVILLGLVLLLSGRRLWRSSVSWCLSPTVTLVAFAMAG